MSNEAQELRPLSPGEGDDALVRWLETLGQEKLACINLSLTKVTDAGIAALAQRCPQLYTLDLWNTGVTDAGIAALAQHCPQLHTLNLSSTKLTDAGIAALVQHCKQLHTLNLTGTQVTDAGIAALARHCMQLHTLDLSSTKLTDAGIAALAQHCPQLHTLNLTGTQVTDAGIAALARHCMQLHTLDLWNTGVTDAGIAALAQHCPQLHTLNLTGTQVTDAGIAALARHCMQLHTLDLILTQVTDAGIAALAQHCPQLHTLNLTGTQVTDAGIAALARHGMQMRPLGLWGARVTLPPELKRSSDAPVILQFFREVQLGRPLLEAKVSILGLARLGKSQLARRLAPCDDPERNDPFVRDASSTHAFEQRTVTRTVRGVDCRLRVFDFGGRPEMHGVHRFFLADQRNVYVVVVSARLSRRVNRLDYWLKMVKRHGGGAPVVVVVSHNDTAAASDEHEFKPTVESLEPLDPDKLSREHGIPVRVVSGYSNVTGQDLHMVWEALEEAVASLEPVFTSGYPAPFFKVHAWACGRPDDTLQDQPPFERYVTVGTFRNICAAAGQTDEKQQLVWLTLLRDLGLLHYVGDRPEVARNVANELGRLVFHPEWVKTPVYNVVQHPKAREHKGILPFATLCDAFGKGMTEDDCRRIMALMEECELIFRVRGGYPEEAEYLIVDQVPYRPENMHRDGWPTSPREYQRWRFPFLPDQLLAQLLGRWFSKVPPKSSYYRDDVVFASQTDRPCRLRLQACVHEQIILLEFDADHETDRKEMLTELRREIRAILDPEGLQKYGDRLWTVVDSEDAPARIAEQRIEENAATRCEWLDLGDLPLEELPVNLGKLQHLRVLSLGQDALRSGPEGLSWTWDTTRPRTRLQHLEPLAGLANLTALSLHGCTASTDLEPLRYLAALTTLSLAHCPNITDLDPLVCLTSLNVLSLFACEAVTDLAPLHGLTALTALDLGRCQSVTDLGPLRGLTSLTALSLFGCTAVTDLSPIERMHQLAVLKLSKCSEVYCFAPIRSLLSHLETLHLARCRFADLPPALCGESDSENVIEEVRRHYLALQAEGLGEDLECKLLVLGNSGAGKTSLVRWFCNEPHRENEPSTHAIHLYNWEPAIRLEGDSVPVQVRVNIWDFGGQGIYHQTHRLFFQTGAIYLVAWDPFGAEHLPLSKGPTVLRQYRPLQYWIDQIVSVDPQARILVVRTKADLGRDRPDPDWSAELPRYQTAIADGQIQFVQLSAKDRTRFGTELLELERWLAVTVATVLGGPDKRTVGKGQLAVKAVLRTWQGENNQVRLAIDGAQAERQPFPNSFIARDHFDRLVRECCAGSPDALETTPVLKWLHRTGVVFWDEKLLGNRILVDQRWAIEGIYALLDNHPFVHRLRGGSGVFTPMDLAAWGWTDAGYTPEEQRLLLDLMCACGHCFLLLSADQSASGQPVYLAPEYLPAVDDPLIERNRGRLRRGFGDQPTVAMETTDPMLYEEMATVLISRVGALWSRSAVYWRNGVAFASGVEGQRAVAEVTWGPEPGAESEFGGRFHVAIWGPDGLALLEPILKAIRRLPHFPDTAAFLDSEEAATMRAMLTTFATQPREAGLNPRLDPSFSDLYQRLEMLVQQSRLDAIPLLTVFVCVADRLSTGCTMHEAAAVLAVPDRTIRRKVNQLGESLGARLIGFEVTGGRRSIVLSPEGAAALGWCRLHGSQLFVGAPSNDKP